MFPTDVVILAGVRTPFARYTGAFKDTSAIELGADAAREARGWCSRFSTSCGAAAAATAWRRPASGAGRALP